MHTTTHTSISCDLFCSITPERYSCVERVLLVGCKYIHTYIVYSIYIYRHREDDDLNRAQYINNKHEGGKRKSAFKQHMGMTIDNLCDDCYIELSNYSCLAVAQTLLLIRVSHVERSNQVYFCRSRGSWCRSVRHTVQAYRSFNLMMIR